MRTFTDEEIIKRTEGLDTFKGWKAGMYEICVRSAADAFDMFDDKAFLYQVRVDGETPKFIMARKVTTNTGSYGLMHFNDYNHEGAAVLKGDYMVYDSHVFGYHKHKKSNPAYVQAKPFPFYRDSNKNQKAEEIGVVHTNEIIGANDHKAGLNSTVIKNWSTACIVTAKQSEYQTFLNFMIRQGKPPLTLVILKEW